MDTIMNECRNCKYFYNDKFSETCSQCSNFYPDEFKKKEKAMGINRYDIYCAYENMDPTPNTLKISTGMYCLWTDHADIVNKLQNCDNCCHDADLAGCVDCDEDVYSNWEMNTGP